MNEKGKYGIRWGQWFVKFATALWVIATYLAVLLLIVVGSVLYARGWPLPKLVTAVMAVLGTTGFHWMLFGAVEHGHIKHMNEEK